MRTIHGIIAFSLASLLLHGSPPRAADWTVTPSLSITGEYNDNLLFSRNNTLHDFITRVSPRFEGRRDAETSRMSFDVALDGEKYALNPDLDTIDGRARVSWLRQWTPRLQTSLNGLLARDQTLNTELEEIGVVSPREERNRVGGDAGAAYALTERWSLGGSLLARYDQYPDGRSPDLAVIQGTINPARQVTERDTAGLVLAASRADYENNTLDRTVSAGISWERKLSETDRFSIQAGYRYTSLDQDVPFLRLVRNPDGTARLGIGLRSEHFTDDGFTFSARLEREWTPRLRTSLAAGRDHTNTSSATSVDRNYVRTTTLFRLTERTTLRAELGYDYTTELGAVEENEHYFRGAPSVSWQVTPHWTLTAGGSYEYSREDNKNRPADLQSRDRFRTWISLSTSWPRLWGKLGSM
jgi:hypothetical protein